MCLEKLTVMFTTLTLTWCVCDIGVNYFKGVIFGAKAQRGWILVNSAWKDNRFLFLNFPVLTQDCSSCGLTVHLPFNRLSFRCLD